MRFFKKFTSIVLSVLMLAFGISTTSTFATGNETVNILVIGNIDTQQKFSKLMFNKKIEGYNWRVDVCNDETIVRFEFCSDNSKISEFVKKNNIKFSDGANHKFNIILTVVDTDQDVEKTKTEVRNMVDFICDYKDDYFQIIVVGCSNRDDISNTDDFMSDIANYVGGIEVECTPNKWGTSSNISFSEQFLCFTCVSKNFDKKNFLGLICRRSKDYENLKKKSQGIVRYAIDEHPVISGAIGLAGLGAVAGACYGIHKGAEKIYNKITNKSLPKKSVPNINKKA